jgi:hypothetical protein
MDFIRKHGSLHRGQRVLQVAFGSGFKCNSAVWLCLNNPPVKAVTVPDYANTIAKPAPAASITAAATTASTASMSSAADSTEGKKTK